MDERRGSAVRGDNSDLVIVISSTLLNKARIATRSPAGAQDGRRFQKDVDALRWRRRLLGELAHVRGGE